MRWSPDGKRIAFTHTADDGIQLWVADVSSGEARALTGSDLNLTMNAPPAWLGSETLIATLVPAGRGAEPAAPRVPSGPVIQENLGRTAPARTYQDLLANPYDEALFEHYATTQLAKVTLDGTVTPLGGPAIVWDFDSSPDGNYILVQTLDISFRHAASPGGSR